MVALALKSGFTRSGWNASDEIQYLTSDGIHWRILARPHVWRPPTDVYEIEDALVVRIEVAGIKESDFSITLEDRYLSVHGVRPDISERRAYYQMEIPFGEFSIDIELPVVVETEAIEAVYRDGFLRIVLPKKRSRLIPIGD